MPIPKGLILYKAARHRENFPVDIKHGCYSDKISSSLYSVNHNQRYSNFHRRSQKKLVQAMSFKFFDVIPVEAQILPVFSRFSGIRKCTIHSLPLLFHDESKKTMMKILQKLFRNFKRIKKLVVYRLGSLQKSPKALKNLLLLNQLESLTLPYFEYSPDPANLFPFVKISHKASKRKSWPNLKSIKICPLNPDETIPNHLDESLYSLWEFLQKFKEYCGNIYERSSFQMILPDCFQINHQQAEIFNEVCKLAPSLTKMNVYSLRDFSGFFNMCQNSRDLQEIVLKTHAFDLEQDFDISPLRAIPTLHRLKLSMFNNGDGKYQEVLPQIEMMVNLTTLSLEFCGRPTLTNKMKCDLVRVISRLSGLKSLKLKFERNREPNCAWLGDVFREIGKKKILEKVSLSFGNFDFEESSQIFKALCKALEKLTQLTSLSLRIMNGNELERKEISWLCQSFTRLPKIQDLKLRISKRDSQFEPKTFALLIDCISKNFPFLSRLVLGFSEVIITHENFRVLYQAVKEMKCLNLIRLMLDGAIQQDVDMRILEIGKRIPGSMQNHLRRAERYEIDFPVNRKFGYYSNKLFTSFVGLYNEPPDTCHKRSKKRFVQKIYMAVNHKSLESKHAIRLFPKYHHIKKCFIEPLSSVYENFAPPEFTRKEFRRTFKILKRIKELKLSFSGQLEAQACKNLLLLKNLESLSIPLFSYDEKSRNMDLFKETVKLASKRKSWKNLRSLKIQLSSPKTLHADDVFPEKSLENLLKFLRDFKEHGEDIYKCSEFQVEVPPSKKISPCQAKILAEIAKIAPSITKISGFEMNKSSWFSRILKEVWSLAEVSLVVDKRVKKHEPDLRVLSEIPNFQNLDLEISLNENKDLGLCNTIIAQIKNLQNLTSLNLSLKFIEIPMITFEDETFDMSRAISNLANLKSFDLFLRERKYFGRSQLSNGLWLRDTLKKIGEKSRLEKLSLSFSLCHFEQPESIFKSLYQSVKKLTDLSVLKLEILTADTIGDEDLMTLCDSLGRIKKIQELTLRVTKKYYFKIKTLLALFDGIANNFPFLSKLELKISCVRTTFESEKLLSAAINRMRCLNCISLDLTGEIESGIDLKGLEAEVNKKIAAQVSHSKTYWP